MTRPGALATYLRAPLSAGAGRGEAVPQEGERGMPMWTVQITGGEDEKIEAGLLATDSGALVALSEDGLLTRAWAPGQWRTVRQVTGVDAHPARRSEEQDELLIGLPRG